MIENPFPESWQNLQTSVCRIFNEIGLNAESGRIFETARGKVELDVYAIDEKSIDKIKYIIECKNWNNYIPQSVVHSFTTVMNEIGGNIGFIISKKGLQPGAVSFTKYTNILGLTFEEFQRRYFDVWFERYFVSKIGDTVDSLTQYVEPFNSYRDKKVESLQNRYKKQFCKLFKKYQILGMTLAFFEFPRYSKQFKIPAPNNIADIKKIIHDSSGGSIHLKSVYFRDLLHEIIIIVEGITNEFNVIFGEDIFAQGSAEMEGSLKEN